MQENLALLVKVHVNSQQNSTLLNKSITSNKHLFVFAFVFLIRLLSCVGHAVQETWSIKDTMCLPCLK